MNTGTEFFLHQSRITKDYRVTQYMHVIKFGFMLPVLVPTLAKINTEGGRIM